MDAAFVSHLLAKSGKKSSSNQFVDYFPGSIRQSHIATMMMVGKKFVVDAQLMENGCLKVVNTNWVCDTCVAKFIGLSENESFFQSAPPPSILKTNDGDPFRHAPPAWAFSQIRFPK